ncbi:MAG TPA: hypothetical protein VJU83_02430 [Burkholderiales bacterium]|nr:hypothetical protein [Burkholderiales bacterium]
MKDANRSTHIDKDSGKNPGGQPAAPQTGKNPGDARDTAQAGDVDKTKLRENRDKLGVDEEHRTPEMEQGKRGTFP